MPLIVHLGVSQGAVARCLEAEIGAKDGAITIEKTEVVVVGGGYPGVIAADRLTRRPEVTVTLINARPSFVERIRPHQLLSGSNEVSAQPR
jgi:NADPH-dependent 2,4-dienoyl-CoA reductase/sulfur reductase-like enzyme